MSSPIVYVITIALVVLVGYNNPKKWVSARRKNRSARATKGSYIPSKTPISPETTPRPETIVSYCTEDCPSRESGTIHSGRRWIYFFFYGGFENSCFRAKAYVWWQGLQQSTKNQLYWQIDMANRFL